VTAGEVEAAAPIEEQRTPLELIDAAYRSLRQETTEELLSRLRACSPAFFESVVVRLLMAMGYGGVAGHGTVTGRSGDGGIDGVIRQDKLELDVVCIQAKRWEGPVGRPVIQGFVGSMDYIQAKKGVIMTTSNFTRDAVDYVDRIEGKKVVLIGGDQLAELMIEHGLGVVTTKTYELKEVSNDFFDESEV
jgi:restriction system protein